MIITSIFSNATNLTVSLPPHRLFVKDWFYGIGKSYCVLGPIKDLLGFFYFPY